MSKLLKADYVFKNGKVITVNSNDDVVSAVATLDNKIIYVGNDKEAEEYIGEHTKVIDLNNKTLTPGFIDAHQHSAHTAAWKNMFYNLDPSLAPNKKKMLELIKKAVDETPEGKWVLFWGYDEMRMEEGVAPTVQELDEIAPNHPLLVGRFCGHVGSFNTKALEIGNINIDTAKNFVEGQVAINDGQLVGQLYETAYYHMWNYADIDVSKLIFALEMESKEILKYGVTTTHDAGSFGAPSYFAYNQAIKAKAYKARVAPMFFNLLGKDNVIRDIKQYIDLGIGILGSERLKYGIMKIMIDGSSSSPSCAVSVPYCHNKGTGILSMSAEEVEEMALTIHKAGLQAAAHCIGDRATEIWVTAVEKAQHAFPREDARHRIEHCGMATPDQINRIKELGMIPTPNTRFLYLNGERYFKFFGERAKSMFPCKSWVDAGVKAAIGTDGPIVSTNPLLGLSSAIDRRTSEGNPIGPEQNITILEAIRMYTYNGAYATFEEDIKGSIEVGKLADLAVYDGDLLKATASELEKIRCVLTMVDGEVVYQL